MCLFGGRTLSTNAVHINDIVITPQLLNRGHSERSADLEKQEFRRLAQQSSYGAKVVLYALCGAALVLCKADSSGVSLLDVVDGEEGFTWDAMAGAMASYVGGRAPRYHSPCGYCLERNSAQLYSDPERHFEWMPQIDLPIVEGLVVPLYGKDQQAIGTIWIVSHQNGHKFDRSNLQVMSTFSSHASAALRMQEIY